LRYYRLPDLKGFVNRRSVVQSHSPAPYLSSTYTFSPPTTKAGVVNTLVKFLATRPSTVLSQIAFLKVLKGLIYIFCRQELPILLGFSNLRRA
jgi:hypothetical protein